MKKILTKNTNLNWLLVNRFISMPIEILVGVLLARYLGPEGLGKISFAISLTTILSILTTFGLDNVVIKHIVEKKINLNILLGTTLTFRIIGSVLLISIANFYSLLRVDDYSIKLMIFILSLGYLFQSFKVIDFYFQAISKCKFTVISQKISLFSGYSLKISAILKKLHLIVFAAITFISDLILALFNIIFFQKYNLDNNSIKNWRFDKGVAKILFLSCWPLAISGLAAQIYIRLDQVILQELVGSNEVGIYSASVRLLSVWYFLTTALGAVFYPKLVAMKLKSKKQYLDFLQFYYVIMFWLAIIITGFMFFTGKYFVIILYGEQYLLSTKPLIISVWSLVGTFLGMAINHYLIVEGRMKIVLIQTIIGSIINIGFNFILIPRYGASGAALATVISYTISTFSFVIFRETRENVRLLLNILNPIIIKQVISKHLLNN